MVRPPRLVLLEKQQELLEKWSRGGSTPYRLVIRSRIILLAAKGFSNRSIARRLEVNPITVARWRSRFLVLGVEGIRHEAPRLGSPPRVPKEIVQEILTRTLFEHPPRGSHWSTRSLARAVGVSHSTVRRIWKSHNVRPPRSRIAAIAHDSPFRPKSIDVLGVYVNPPQRAVAISLSDEGLSNTYGPLQAPMGRSARSTRASSWISDLVSTLNLLDNRPPRGSAQRLVDPEFLSFLRSVQSRRQGDEKIQLLAVTDTVPKPFALTRWLQRHPEFSAHVQVGNASLRKVVADWFGDASPHHPTGSPPASLPGLRTAVERWAREASDNPRPFAWTRK